MAAKKKPKQASGGARLKLAGRHPVLLGLLPEDKAIIWAAAKAEDRPVANFVVYHAVQAAKKILGNPDYGLDTK